MRRSGFAFAVVAAASIFTAPGASASVASFCGDLGGQWDGQYCRATVVSPRKAVRDIKIAIPGDVDNPASGGVIGDYLTKLMNNWRSAAGNMVADSYGEANFETFQHGNLHTVVFHETYHADGPWFANAYRTFTFDTGSGRQVQLADLLNPGTPLSAIPPLAAPFIQTALDEAQPQHDPNTYPFVADRWTPDKVYSGGYKAWAITPNELILYLPDYPVGRDTPTDYNPQIMQWSMDGGTVQPRIPLSALAPIMRPGLV